MENMRDRCYPKIKNLYEREPDGKRELIFGKFNAHEFGLIKYWDLYEKIDGTNIRIIIENGKVEFRGKTNTDNNIPKHLLAHLQAEYPFERFEPVFGEKPVILFGEGCGYKINNGGNYCAENQVKFVGFDILFYGTQWATQDTVSEIYRSLGIESAPLLFTKARINEFSVVEYRDLRDYVNVFIHKTSACSSVLQPIEGFIGRPYGCNLYSNNHERILWKLRAEDFK